jgi:hypothetical protein
MRAYFGVYYVDENGHATLCEVDGGICYEAYATEREAHASVAQGINQIADWNAHRRSYEPFDRSTYEVRQIPEGTRVWDRYADRADIAGAHTGPAALSHPTSRLVLYGTDPETGGRTILDIVEQDLPMSEFMTIGLGADFLSMARRGIIPATHYCATAGYAFAEGLPYFPWWPIATVSRV